MKPHGVHKKLLSGDDETTDSLEQNNVEDCNETDGGYPVLGVQSRECSHVHSSHNGGKDYQQEATCLEPVPAQGREEMKR